MVIPLTQLFGMTSWIEKGKLKFRPSQPEMLLDALDPFSSPRHHHRRPVWVPRVKARAERSHKPQMGEMLRWFGVITAWFVTQPNRG